MSREICFECGKFLAYKKGVGTIHRIWIDPIGNEHKLHKFCYTASDYKEKQITATESKLK